ncbi:MAG: hypothetical protein P8X81_08505 [Woeseiaceae bacterium]|jgi:hypothetical protein
MAVQLGKKLALGAALMMATLGINSALADGDRPFKMRFAGGFVQNFLQLQVDMAGMPTEDVETRSIAFGKGKGTFGRADVVGVSIGGPPVSEQQCSNGFIKVADITENNLLLTFDDLSMLYGNGTGVVCLNPANPTEFPIAEIDGTWDGGTGRFAGVSGNWSIRFDYAEPIGVTTQFAAEAAVITGHITRTHDHD